MATQTKHELPSPPTFSQMMEDLEIMASHDKTFQLEHDGIEYDCSLE
jgi:hypothetical protein